MLSNLPGDLGLVSVGDSESLDNNRQTDRDRDINIYKKHNWTIAQNRKLSKHSQKACNLQLHPIGQGLSWGLVEGIIV